MAILLLERKGGLNEFTDEIVNRSDVQAMIQKVDFGVHPEAEAAGYDKMTTILEIVLKDGRTITGRADFGKGSPANPMSYDEVADKFRECAAYSRWPKTKAEQVVEMVAEDVDRARQPQVRLGAGQDHRLGVGIRRQRARGAARCPQPGLVPGVDRGVLGRERLRHLAAGPAPRRLARATRIQVRLLLVKGQFDFPTLVVVTNQLQGREPRGIEQR